jgi:hypothetical protein
MKEPTINELVLAITRNLNQKHLKRIHRYPPTIEWPEPLMLLEVLSAAKSQSEGLSWKDVRFFKIRVFKWIPGIIRARNICNSALKTALSLNVPVETFDDLFKHLQEEIRN